MFGVLFWDTVLGAMFNLIPWECWGCLLLLVGKQLSAGDDDLRLLGFALLFVMFYAQNFVLGYLLLWRSIFLSVYLFLGLVLCNMLCW